MKFMSPDQDVSECHEDVENPVHNKQTEIETAESSPQASQKAEIEVVVENPIDFKHLEIEKIESAENVVIESNFSKVVKSSALLMKLQEDINNYIVRLHGVPGGKSPAKSPTQEIICSSILSFITILIISSVKFWVSEGVTGLLLSGSYGATSILLCECYRSPFAQPRNVIGSYIVCSFVGVAVRQLLCDVMGLEKWTAGGFAVALALIGMSLTKSNHPPGGGTALIAVIGSDSVLNLGFKYVGISFGAALLMVAMACLGNNLIPNRTYPSYWW